MDLFNLCCQFFPKSCPKTQRIFLKLKGNFQKNSIFWQIHYPLVSEKWPNDKPACSFTWLFLTAIRFRSQPFAKRNLGWKWQLLQHSGSSCYQNLWSSLMTCIRCCCPIFPPHSWRMMKCIGGCDDDWRISVGQWTRIFELCL